MFGLPYVIVCQRCYGYGRLPSVSVESVDIDEIEETIANLRAAGYGDLAARLEAAVERAREDEGRE